MKKKLSIYLLVFIMVLPLTLSNSSITKTKTAVNLETAQTSAAGTFTFPPANRKAPEEPRPFDGLKPMPVERRKPVAASRHSHARTPSPTRLAAPRKEASPRKVTSGGIGGDFARLRGCESGGNYAINTGNGYYGAYQFDLRTWRGLGFSGRPDQASPGTQDAAAKKLHASRGFQPWPGCRKKLNLT